MPRSSSFAPSLSRVCLLAALFVSACGSSDEGEDTNAGEESTSQSSADTETETGDPVCFPEGIYGPCSGENMGCQCLMGADVYQVCTISCVDDADCGDPADFPGAMPSCLPVNAGAMEKVCSLACTSTAQCPCGLTCQTTTTGICAETL
jgi:hypothetical protein